MPGATKRPLSEWRDTEWLQYLQRQARRLTACPHHADDLAHTYLIAFYDHHHCYPWQHPEPAHALRWCCQKLRALACDAHRYAERHPCLALETLPESVACVDIAAQVQGDIDGERFLASLPPCLRTALALRLAGYSWEQAAQQLGVKASTLRGYLPELGAKFVDFFGYDPSKRASESLVRAEGKTAPSDDRGGDTDEGDARIGERLGDDTEHAGGVNPLKG
jgi:DNA-directed RNA polymerase specialized sigma24 family protein